MSTGRQVIILLCALEVVRNPTMQYKLTFDSDLEEIIDKQEAYVRMSRARTWLSDGWWIPNPSQNAEKRIGREGFMILNTKKGNQ